MIPSPINRGRRGKGKARTVGHRVIDQENPVPAEEVSGEGRPPTSGQELPAENCPAEEYRRLLDVRSDLHDAVCNGPFRNRRALVSRLLFALAHVPLSVTDPVEALRAAWRRAAKRQRGWMMGGTVIHEIDRVITGRTALRTYFRQRESNVGGWWLRGPRSGAFWLPRPLHVLACQARSSCREAERVAHVLNLAVGSGVGDTGRDELLDALTQVRSILRQWRALTTLLEQLLISAATETPDEDLPGDEDAQAPADPDPPRTFRYRSHETPLNEDDPTHLLAGAVGREALAA